MQNAPTGAHAYDLRVDGRRRPLTLAGPFELQWRMSGDVTPTTVRVQAARTAAALADGLAEVWDSGDVAYSGPSLAWSGPELKSGSVVHWRVGLGSDGVVSWSESSVLGTALRHEDDWRGARWITHPAWADGDSADALPVVHTTFTAPDDATGARLYLAASGVVSVTINGQAASPDVLAPGYSDYDERIAGIAWDVSSAVQSGLNTLRIELGTGVSWVPETSRYTKFVARDVLPRVLARLVVDSATAPVSLVTDPTWDAALTATTVAHWFGGEDHDARLADHAEAPAVDLGPPATHRVWWSEQPGLRVVDRIAAVEVTRHESGARIVDFGINVAGWPQLTLTAPAGVELQLWPGELLDDSGLPDQKSTGTPLYDTYITHEGSQSWHPRFVYHGFRFLEVRGLDEAAPDPGFEALVIRADNATAGGFDSDDDYLVTLDRLIDRSIQGNMYSVFTDCPNREKLGWIEQLYLCFDALARHYDVDAHLRDAIVHMADAQLESGSIPSIAPESVDFSNHEFNGDANAFREDPNWGGAIVFLPWRLYENYGDRAALDRAWPSIRRYLDFLRSRDIDGIVDFGLGDWIALDTTTPRAMVSTFGYLRVLETAALVADALGEPAGMPLREDAERVRTAFAARFLAPDGTWGSGSQGSYALALDSGAVPRDGVEDARARLLVAIADHGGRLSVGENSWPSLMRVLHAMGRDDVTAALVRNDEGPGYAWQLRHGATALAESWLGATGAVNDNSQNHFMLGMVHDWMSQVVGGLAQAEESVAWSRARIAPTPVEGVTSMDSSYESPLGRYAVSWRDDARFALQVDVPPGGAATVVLPRGGAQHEVGPGTWRFES